LPKALRQHRNQQWARVQFSSKKILFIYIRLVGKVYRYQKKIRKTYIFRDNKSVSINQLIISKNKIGVIPSKKDKHHFCKELKIQLSGSH
jgi:hypothetical protein